MKPDKTRTLAEKRQTEQNYLGEDALFLILKLLDYPQGRERTHTFDELPSLNFRVPIWGVAFHVLSDLKRNYGIQLDHCEFDTYGIYFSGETNRYLGVHFSNLLHDDRTEKYGTLRKILSNTFVFSDLETLYTEQPQFLPVLISGINFRITVGEKAGEKILEDIRKYLTLFQNDALIKTDTVYLDFESHKKLFERRISEDFEKNGTAAILSDNEFPHNFLLLHTALALEEAGDVEIKSIIGKKTHEHVRYLVSVWIKNSLLKRIGKNTNPLRPQYAVRDRFLFFFPDGTKESAIKIGKNDSQKAKLLRYLVQNFEVGRSIQDIYENIRPDDLFVSTIRFGAKKDPDGVVSGTIKELQRGKKLKGFEIETSMGHVRLVRTGKINPAIGDGW